MRFLILTAVAVFIALSIAKSNEDCSKLGFVKDSLPCTTCDEMKIFFSDETLINDCLSCCGEVKEEATQENALDDAVKYTKAVLRFAPWKIRSFPEVLDFVNTKMDEFKNLSLDEYYDEAPQLVLTKTDNSEETVTVSNWKADQIKEFLKEKLQ
ncbi:selenoprotein SEP15 [Acrasis kona]|uniref:Selenoprotein F n=1 Tax=Acrasis kona TaxID=1008807 RepID=A0AAW2ZEZ3_9EUKA